MSPYFVFLSLLAIFSLSTNKIRAHFVSTPKLHIERDSSVVLAKWNEMGHKFQKLAQAYTNTAWTVFNRTSQKFPIRTECVHGVNRMFTDFVTLKMWAVQMIDSTGYHGGGMLFNNWISPGDYEHCLDVQGPKVLDQELVGKYCVIHFRPPMPPRIKTYRKPPTIPALDSLTSEFELVQKLKSLSWDFYDRGFRYGVCIPSTCVEKDLEIFAGQLSKEIGFNAMVNYCQTLASEPLETHHKYILCLLLAFAAIVILTSFIPGDPKSETTMGKIKKTFSFTHHASQLLAMPKRSDPKTSHINGLKGIATLWVIVVHFLLVGFLSRAYHGHERVKNFCQSFINQITVNSILSMDTFFFSTAVILTYAKYRKGVPVKNGIRPTDVFEIIIPIIRRYLRILPMCLVVTGITFLLPFSSGGPLWKDMTASFGDTCLKNWWKIIYFGSNFDTMDEMCANQLWYISVDLQLFLLFSLFTFFYCRNKRLSYYLLIVTSVFSMIWMGLKTYINDDPPAFIFHNINVEVLHAGLQSNYQSPFSHVSVYCLGIGTGLCLTKVQEIKLSKATLIGGWIASFSLFYYAIFSSFTWNNGILPSPMEAALYVVFSKFFWAVSHSWLVVTCTTGNMENLNKFLSAPVFEYGGRIMFSFYVSNLPVLIYFAASNQSLTDLRYANVWSQALLMVVISLIAGFFLHLIYERPLAELVSYITPPEWSQPHTPTPKEFTKEKYIAENIEYINQPIPSGKNKNL